MKLPLSWLADWVDLALDGEGIARLLTMRGLEVEAVASVGERLDKLVVGRVLEVKPHPNADRLSLCRVDVGGAEPLGIVCGARNVRAGGTYAVALPGAALPGGMMIKASRIRGEPSAGMLCSATELGLESPIEGLFDLDGSLSPGEDASAALRLGEAVLDINITPNRADCFSVLGIARELSASGGRSAREPQPQALAAAHSERVTITVSDVADCPRFLGRVIRGIRADAHTPLWMCERLRRAGIRPLHPVVDVTNYVMLELGQPLHAYDLATLSGGIAVRCARSGESLRLLDGRSVSPAGDVLVIADDSGAIGLAGVMGGVTTAVTPTTRDVFLECAWFSPAAITGRARALGLHTDASVRFERGVDPTIQAIAIEHATALIVAIAGGAPGPVSIAESADHLPARPAVRLRRQRLVRVLGTAIPDEQVEQILRGLRMRTDAIGEGWDVVPPPARFDIEREEDLIEEVARVFGYERISAAAGLTPAVPATVGEVTEVGAQAGGILIARGYQEVITYSFIAAEMDRLFGAEACDALALNNPISAELAVMRQSLWPGLALAMQENLRRQQPRVRLFEVGPRFGRGAAGLPMEQLCVAGIAAGSRFPEQWAIGTAEVDFYDAKADVEALLAGLGWRGSIRFEAGQHPALHPGRSARILAPGDQPLGWLGELHPRLGTHLDMPGAVLFELEFAPLLGVSAAAHRALSMFPSVRRDIAVVVPRELAAADLLAAVKSAVPVVLREAFVFDIYTGPQVGEAEKSVAIGLILQDPSRTLTDEETGAVLETVRSVLSRQFKARIRE